MNEADAAARQAGLIIYRTKVQILTEQAFSALARMPGLACVPAVPALPGSSTLWPRTGGGSVGHAWKTRRANSPSGWRYPTGACR